MSTDLTVINLFISASPLVQGVIISLLLASFVSWTIIFQRWMAFRSTRAVIKDFEHNFWSGVELKKLYQHLMETPGKLQGTQSIFVSGFKEFIKLRQNNIASPRVIMEGVRRSMYVAYNRELDKLELHLSFLATVQSISPYVGLFGTVWGIMHSFRSLASQQQATIAMVAPGISEALIATAMGLIAAIPAGIAYNRYVQRANSLGMQYRLFMEEFMGIIHNKLHAGSSVEEISNVQQDDNDD